MTRARNDPGSGRGASGSPLATSSLKFSTGAASVGTSRSHTPAPPNLSSTKLYALMIGVPLPEVVRERGFPFEPLRANERDG